MSMETRTYTGLITEHSCGDPEDILFLSSVKRPLADELSWRMLRKIVTVRYWVSDQEITKEAAQDTVARELMGMASGKGFQVHYSELSGYLWTDENIVVGGHSLIDQLRSFVGKWLILEIETH